VRVLRGGATSRDRLHHYDYDHDDDDDELTECWTCQSQRAPADDVTGRHNSPGMYIALQQSDYISFFIPDCVRLLSAYLVNQPLHTALHTDFITYCKMIFSLVDVKFDDMFLV